MSINKETCYTVICDGCKTVFDEHGDTILHYDSPAAAENDATEKGWLITVDGRHMCECCWSDYACTQSGHIYTEWRPCACNGNIPEHQVNGCGLWRACNRQGCWFEESATLATLPTIDEPRRSR